MVTQLMRVFVIVSTAALAGVLLVGGVGVSTDDGVTSAVHEEGDSPDWVHEANFTLKLADTEPGTTTDIMFWASLPQTDRYGDGLGEAKFVQMWLPQGQSGGDLEESSCTRDDIVVAGIDRGANDSGTAVDTSLVSNIKNYDIARNDDGQIWATVEAFGKEDFGGEHVTAHYSDEAVVRMGDCYRVPSEPGWYRGGVYANGSNYQGEYIEAAGYTAYFYLCDCEDREAAIEKLGEPPVAGTGTEGSVVRADRDGVFGERLNQGPPQGWDLVERRDPGAERNQGSDSTPDGGDGSGSDGGSDERTTTPAPTANGGGDGSASDASGDGSTPAGDDGSASTSAPTADGGSDGANSDGGGDDPAGTTGGDAASNDDPGTPTASQGPGFGPLVALVGLLASALLASRRA